MKSFLLKSILVTLLVPLSTAIAEEGETDEPVDAPACLAEKPEYKECLSAVEQAATALQGAMQTTSDETSNINGIASQVQAAAKSCEDAMAPLKDEVCRKARDLCQSACAKEQQQCHSAIDAQMGKVEQAASQCKGMGDQAGDTSQQSTSDAGAGMDPSSLLPALSGMMPKPKQEEKKKEEKGALNPDGTLDCSKWDAWKYDGCADKLAAKCMLNFENGDCKRFSGVFCADVEQNDKLQTQSAKNMVPGSGKGSIYCKTLTAWNYCQGDVAGRAECPSCQELSAMQTQTCKDNPALCLAQNSPEQIAASKKLCPSDPKFKDVKFVSGGGNTVNNNSNINPTGSQLPNVVLPQSASNAAHQVQSARHRGTASVSASAGVRGQTVSPGPASDVVGPTGPTLFSTASEAIQNKCQLQQFFNCPNSQ